MAAARVRAAGLLAVAAAHREGTMTDQYLTSARPDRQMVVLADIWQGRRPQVARIAAGEG